VLVLDEPTSGLDPHQVIAVRELIRELAGKRTVLVASHVLSEIAQIASRVMILLDGKLLTSDALKRSTRTQYLRLAVTGPEAEVRVCIGAVPGVRSISSEANSAALSTRYLVEADQQPGIAQDIANVLADRRLALSELVAVPPDLEQVFLALTRRPEEEAA